jgi:hypothetical protein
MTNQKSKFDLAFQPTDQIPNANDVQCLLARLSDPMVREEVEWAIDSECSGDLPCAGLSSDELALLEAYIDGTEIAFVRLGHDNAMIDLCLRIAAFRNADNEIEYRCKDDAAGKETKLATIPKPATFGQVIGIVVDAIETYPEGSWTNIAFCDGDGEIDEGSRFWVSSGVYPQMADWFDDARTEFVNDRLSQS